MDDEATVEGTSAKGVGRREFLRLAGKTALLLPAAGGGLSLLLSDPASGATKHKPRKPHGKAKGPTISETLETPFGLIFSFVEFYVAKEQGFWAKQGLDIKIVGGTGTASAVQAVLGGSSAYSRGSGIDSIIAVAKTHAPVTTVGMCFQRSEFNITSLASKPLRDPKELAGKTIGVVSPNGATQELLECILKRAGVNLSSVNMPVVGVGPAALQLAKSGKIDGWVALDTDIKAFEAAGTKLVWWSTDKYAKIPADNYMVADSLIRSHPKAITGFLTGIFQAMEFAQKKANFDKVVSATRAINPQITRNIIAQQLPIIAADWTAGGTRTPVKLYPKEWESAQKLLVKTGFIPRTVALDKLIDPSFADKALS